MGVWTNKKNKEANSLHHLFLGFSSLTNRISKGINSNNKHPPPFHPPPPPPKKNKRTLPSSDVDTTALPTCFHSTYNTLTFFPLLFRAAKTPPFCRGRLLVSPASPAQRRPYHRSFPLPLSLPPRWGEMGNGWLGVSRGGGGGRSHAQSHTGLWRGGGPRQDNEAANNSGQRGGQKCCAVARSHLRIPTLVLTYVLLFIFPRFFCCDRDMMYPFVNPSPLQTPLNAAHILLGSAFNSNRTRKKYHQKIYHKNTV